jgi:hypothetical protein
MSIFSCTKREVAEIIIEKNIMGKAILKTLMPEARMLKTSLWRFSSPKV